MSIQLCLVIPCPASADALRDYLAAHQPGGVPSAVLEGMKAAGIEGCHIYHAQDQLVMVIDASDGFTMASAAAINRGNAVVQQWNRRMAALLSGDDRNAPPWNEAHCIFDLERHLRS